MYTTTVSSQRQVTLPKSLLEKMKVQPGDKIRFEVSGKQAALHRVPHISELAGCLNKYAIYPVPTDEETDQAVMDYVGKNYLAKNATTG